MKNLIYIVLMLLLPMFAFSQVYVKAPNGHTGVGIDTPTEKLDVNGNAKVRGTSFKLGLNEGLSFNTYHTNGVSNILHSGTNILQFVSANSTEIDFRSGGALRMRLWKTGPMQIWSTQARKPGGGPWLGASDKRLKKNIQPYRKGLEELLQVNPVSYYYIGDVYKNAAKEQHVGVVAQELQKVVPTMVGDFDLTDQEGKSKGTYLSVNSNEFTYMLINAVKEQQDKIENLEEELAEMKEMIRTVLDGQNTEINQQDINLDGRGAYLEQNQPNPFNANTLIKYNVPTDVKNALVNIFDENGRLIHTERIAQMGVGQLSVKAGSITAGTYSYSLVVDGNVVDTKRMVIVK